MTKNLLPLLLLFISANAFSQTFNSIWNTANTGSGSSAVNEITIPTNPAYTTYNYTVDWGDGDTDTGVTGDITHTYASQGTYTVTISGTFPSIYFNDSGDKLKIIEILQWGDIQWRTMESAFHGCENINFDAIDEPDLSLVTSLKDMFRECTSFNGILNDWDVSTITDISGLFAEAEIFNRPLDNWNTSAITDMSYTFHRARLFNEPLDNWNTGSVTTMEFLFSEASRFDQNINNWNVTQVTNMSGTFRYTGNFDRPLNNWIVDGVTDMSGMFQGSAFNQPIANWNVDNVTTMSAMFRESQFNHPIEIWNVGQVTDMSFMFHRHRTFDHPLNNWNVSNVTNMASMFDGWIWGAIYNQPLDNWDVSKVSDMNYMFRDNSGFDQDISGWDVSQVTNMSGMFRETVSFNQDVSIWDVSSVTNMASMFQEAVAYNQPLEAWDVSAVTDMNSMFFNTPLFNRPLNGWVVNQVTNMANMFRQNPVFDQPLNNWNTASVTNMSGMFQSANAFDQNLAVWDVTSITNMATMLSNSGLSQENYDDTLIGWAAQTVNNNVNLGAANLTYCDGLAERQQLIDNHNWNIGGDSVNCSYVLCTQITSPYDGDTNVPANSDIRWAPAPNATGYRVSITRENGGSTQVIYNNQDFGNVVGLDFTNEFTPGDNVSVTVVPYNDEGPATGCQEINFTTVASWVNSPDAFKITVDTRNLDTNSSAANQYRLELNDGYPDNLTYDFSIDWGDNQYDNNVTNDITHTYLTPGIYAIAIIGDYPSHYHPSSNRDNLKLISMDQWGTQVWGSMASTFYFCENMEYNATDIPNLSQVTNMQSMFRRAVLFNTNINDWDVSNVTNMGSLFYQAYEFDQPLNNWDVGSVTNMYNMFASATNFNQNIDGWNTENVLSMNNMFSGTQLFDQPLNGWDVGNVTTMADMFSRAQAFNQPLNNWNVGQVTDMSSMFESTDAFDQPIGVWNVGDVTLMNEMFKNAEVFNQPLNDWNVANVTNMFGMFDAATVFNQPLDQWNVGLVTNMAQMFYRASAFNQNIDSWNVTNVIDMRSMFQSAVAFDQPLNSWNVNSVVNMQSMFQSAETFDQALDAWDVSAVANMSSMFNSALLFDQPLNTWNVSSVTLMNRMFENAEVFNQPLDNWNVSSVTTMEAMFKDAVVFDRPLITWDTGEVLNMREMFHGASAFNQSIDTWDTSFVTTMRSMFENAIAFDQTLNAWNVASVSTMEKMFKGATTFNGAIGAWNVRGVDTMEEMFNEAAAFNQSINNWRVTGVTNMDAMFEDASTYNQAMDLWNLGSVSMQSTFANATALDQYLGDWDISNVTDMTDMLDNTALTRENYDNTLIAWSEQTLTSGITLGAEGLPYCDAVEERQSMIDNYGWTISDDILDCPVPVCTTLTSPLNGDTDVPVNTNLTWEPAVFARGYRLTVGTTVGGNDIVANETINDATSYEFAADFSGGETVFVTLIPFNDTGDAVGPCTEESFTISSDPATVPDCTDLIEPLNGATDVSIDTDLSWNPIANADGYRLTIGTSPTGTDILNNEDVLNVTTYELPADLPEDSTIYVTVTPYNDQGNAIACTPESFETELIPVPPACTTLAGPIDGATDIPIDTNLSWTAVPEATGYLVVVGTTSGGIEIVNNVDVNNATTYDIPEDLLENRTYYVTIIPYNAVGDATGCIEESFTTGDSTSPPSCALLSTPVNGATNVALDTDLSWNGSGSATGYRLTVGTTSGGTEIFTGDIGNLTTHDLTAELPASTMIYVTITAYNDNGDATGCTEESFMTDGPPACTTLITPADGATNLPIDTNIEWNASTDADGYKLTVTASSSTANNLTDFDVTTGTTYDFPNDFERGETVTVTIVPYNALGDASGCTSESFTIIPPPVPLCTALNGPGDGDLDVPVDTDISWIASTGAEGYTLTVTASSSTANNLTDFDVTSGTSQSFANDFEPGETVTVTLVPYNSVGDAIGCTSEVFTIQSLPACTNLTLPTNGATDIQVDTRIEWTPIADADGYTLNVTASSSTANNLNDYVLTTGNTYDFPNDFEQGETVTVNIVPYNAAGDAIGCTSESFTIQPLPVCTNLITPANGTIDVPVDTDIEWAPITDADGYRLTVIASSSTANNVTDLVVSTGTSYNFPSDFEQGETVEVTLVPYNAVGDAIGCSSESFTIKSVPLCTNLSAPMNGAVVAGANEISWNAIAEADGYRLSIAAGNTTSNNITDLDVVTTSYVFPNDFGQGEVVTVTIIPYNEIGDAIGCSSESFTIRPLPSCISLAVPLNGATEVPVTTDIDWEADSDADGYRISVGTAPNGTDIVNNEDVASLTSYTFAEDLPSENLIYITIVPYNTSGDAVGCTSESFETEVIVPNCTALLSPFTNETEVPLDTGISWEETEKTDGYRLSLGTSPGGSDIVNNQDVGAVTSYRHTEELPFGTEIYVRVIPYNSKGDAVQCEPQSFTTEIPEDETKYGFSPDGDGINEYWHIENIQYHPENIVTIYNRWGDAVFKIANYDNTGNVFRGEANQMTKMGAGTLPAGTYFFTIEVEGESILKKTKGFLVLKR
ncbi:MAG: BspA family leucine-rich repeat surface protein [Pricia sp.]